MFSNSTGRDAEMPLSHAISSEGDRVLGIVWDHHQTLLAFQGGNRSLRSLELIRIRMWQVENICEIGARGKRIASQITFIGENYNPVTHI